MSSDNAGGATVALRHVPALSYYVLAPTGGGLTDIELRARGEGTTYKVVAKWPIPRSYRSDEWARLELRAVGDQFTASIDGHVLGTVEDSTWREAGGVALGSTR